MFLKNRAGTALISRGEEISYQALVNNAVHYSTVCKGAGKVAIFSENRAEWIYSLYAAWHGGAIVVPIDYMAATDEVVYILEDCRAEVIFCSLATLPNLEEIISRLSYDPRVVIMDEVGLPADSPDAVFNEPELERTALIVYTSGTTGGAKGVMISFANLDANIKAVSEGCPIFTPGLRVMMMLPCHHILPVLGTIACPLAVGCTIVICPSLIPADIIETLRAHKVNMIIGVPRFYNLIYNGIKARIDAKAVTRGLFRAVEKMKSPRLSKIVFGKVHRKMGGEIQYLISGGAALDVEVANGLTTLGFLVLEGYGMTETAPMITFPRPDNVRLGSCGQPLDCCEVKLDAGEIVVRGANVMQGYYNKPEATAETIDEDGWLHTGDLGQFDDDGFLFITGRKKELIILPNGKNISPHEVESKLISKTEYVRDAAVFMDGNSLHALVYPTKGQTGETIQAQVITPYNESTSPYKKILKYTLVDNELPRTRLGKLKRFELPELAAGPERAAAGSAEPDSPEYREIKKHLQTYVSTDVLPDDHLEFDLALDSLQRVSLMAFLRDSFGVKVDDKMLQQYPTVRKLADQMRAWKVKFNTRAITDWAEILKEKVSFTLPRSTGIHSFIQRTFKALLRSLFRIRGRGTENIPDDPCIFVPNHQSYLDSMFTTVMLRTRRVRRMFFYAKRKHVRSRFARAVADRCNIIVMDMEQDLKASIQKLARVLRDGNSIMIFPEGTRSQDGVLGEFKKTFAILSSELNVPVVPVAINGAYDVLPRGSRIPRLLKRVTVDFLPPVHPSGESYDELNDKVRNRIAAALERQA